VLRLNSTVIRAATILPVVQLCSLDCPVLCLLPDAAPEALHLEVHPVSSVLIPTQLALR
jgi:hypothetical protein